ATRARLAEALTPSPSQAAGATGTERTLVVTTARKPGAGIEITIAPSADRGVKPTGVGVPPASESDANGESRRADGATGGTILARRLISIQGERADDEAGAYVIRLAGS